MDNDCAGDGEMYISRRTDQMIRYMCIAHFILEMPQSVRYLSLLEADRINIDTNRRISLTMLIFSALSACSFIVIFLIFHRFEMYPTKRHGIKMRDKIEDE
jgi:hypothetical protein